MKVNGTQGEYVPVSQGLQSDEDETHLGRKAGRTEVPIKNGVLESTTATKDVEATKSIHKSEKAPMSPLRKVCFVLSLLQCALFIIAFGWLIPCKLPRYLENPAKNWEYPLNNIDVLTSFGSTKLDKKSSPIIFGYQSSNNASNFGFLALNAFNGIQMWNRSLPNSPSSLACGDSFRSSPDGPISCLIVDQGGIMANIRAADGEIEWYVHSHNTTLVSSELSTPAIGPDCNNDTISEIFVAGVNGSSKVLYIISGYNGQLLKSIYLTSCTTVPTKIIPWFLDGQQQIVFSCMDTSEFENVWAVPLSDLCGTNNTHTGSASFDSLDTRTLHSLEKDNILLDILSVPINKSTNDYHLILITKNGHIVQLLNNDSKTPWTYEVPSELVLKDATNGCMLNETSQNIAVLAQDASKPNITTIIILDETTGNLLVNYTFVNQTATSIYSVANGENVKDGLLVRTLSPSVEVPGESKPQEVVKEDTKTVPYNFVNVAETFLLMECSSNVTFVDHLILPLVTKCGGNGCSPDLYKEVPKVILTDVDDDGSSELVQIVSVLTNNLDIEDVGNNIKLSRLSTAPSKCGSCGCS